MLIKDNKDSGFNNSIANQWGQWKYFNSSLAKLGDTKPITPNIVAKPKQVDDNQVDWMAALGVAAEGALGYFDERKKQGIDIANKYLENHSMEEYRDQMRQGSVPFQDDPWAMQELAKGYGKVFFGATQKAFMDNVARGDYKELKPEQLDAAFFDFANSELSGTARDFGFSEDDSYFKRGFFENSKAARISAMASNVAVRDEDLRFKALVQRNAKMTGILNSPQGNAKQKVGALLDTFGECRTAEDVGKSFDYLKKQLENSPYGAEVIDELKDKELKQFGVKINDLIDPDSLNTIKINSLNVRDAQNAEAWTEFATGVMDHVNKGNVTQVYSMLRLEGSTNGVKTNKYKYLMGAYDQAQHQAKVLSAQAEAAYNLESQGRYFRERLNSQTLGKPVDSVLQDAPKNFPNIKEKDQLSIAKDFVDIAIQEASNGNQERLKNVLSLTQGDDPDSKIWSRALGSYIEEIQGKLDSDIDEYMLKGRVSGADGVSSSLLQISSLYTMNPMAMRRAYKTGSPESYQMMVAANAVNSGQPEKALKFLAGVKQFQAKYNDQEGKYLTVDVNKVLGEKVGVGAEPILKNMILFEATNMYSSGLGMKPRDCVKEATKIVQDSYTTIGKDLMLPTDSLAKRFVGLKGDVKTTVDLSGLADDAIKVTKERWENTSRMPNGSFDIVYTNYIYNMVDDSIRYVSANPKYESFSVHVDSLSKMMYQKYTEDSYGLSEKEKASRKLQTQVQTLTNQYMEN